MSEPTAESPIIEGTSPEHRAEFLLNMYGQLWGNISRQITGTWQSIGAVVGSFALLALVEKDVISIDIGTTLIIALGCWLLLHLIDSSHWYNRNLAILSNIERVFLNTRDLKNIHYFFGKHRPENKMINLFRIQCYLVYGLLIVTLIYHFDQQFLKPNFEHVEWQLFLPYAFLIIGILLSYRQSRTMKEKYQELITNSPGIDIESEGVSYGAGHGY